MDQPNKPGIQPLPLGQAVADAAKAAVPDKPSLDEKVDAWVDAHPDGANFEDPATPVARTVEPVEAPPTETPTPAPPGDAPTSPPAETEVQQPPLPGSATPPEPAAKVEAPKVEEPKPPAVAEPVRFSLDAKYRFADSGPEWTGQQVVDALRERQQLIPKAQEAETYREVFDMPAAQAKELWAPNLAWLRQNPDQVQMIASIMDDPHKAAYMRDCSSYWDSPEGQQLRQQQQPQQAQQLRMSPEVEARFKQLESQNKQLLDAENSRKSAQMTDRITRELNVAFQRYPYLRDNPTMVQALLARAYWLNGGDDSENSRGVLDALEMERDLYDSKLTALNAASSIARDAAVPAPPVPPLMGNAGASPSPSPTPRVASNKKFGSLDDAVEDWVNNPPAQFR